MPTQSIPLADWQTFFDRFSRQHAGWLCTVAILSTDGRAGLEARQIPLEGVTLDLIDGGRTVSIILRGKGSEHVTRIVRGPQSVVLRQTEQGADEAVVIESGDGTKTILRFRSAMLAEMVDGVP